MESDDKNRFVDKWLDEALRQRGAIEPRPGLERRILANLRADSHRRALRPHWWPVLATAGVLALITVSIFIGRELRHTPVVVIGHPDVPQTMPPRAHVSAPAVVGKASRPRISGKAAKPARQEQFPSPQPLSDQEKMLADYVAQFRQSAVLVAEAQTELLKQEMPDQQFPGIKIQPISDQEPDQSNP